MIGRIGAGLSGFELKLLNRLAEANAAVTLSSLRLATDRRINAPSDDPAGFIELNGLESQLNIVTSTLGNVDAASSITSQLQLALDQIRTQLDIIREKAIEDQDQGLTADERAANQAAIDAAITEINQLASADINGRRLLDGSADFVVAGLNNSEIFDLSILALGGGTSTMISGTVTVAAQRASLTHNEAGGTISNDATFTLTGDRGDVSISVADGETLSTVATRISQESHLTGITASVSGNDLILSSINYGSQADIDVEVTSGTFAVTGGNGDGTANGVDAVATINGLALTGNGNRFAFNQNGLSFTLEFEGGFSGAFDDVTVSAGGLNFALSTNLNRRSTLAVPGMQASRLGGLSGRLDQLYSGGSLSGLGTNAPQAIRVVDEALSQLTRIEGRVDGFADATIDSASGLLNSMQTVLQGTIDSIDEVDEDAELLLRAKNLSLASNVLAGLTILRQQRGSIVALIQQIAGLI